MVCAMVLLDGFLGDLATGRRGLPLRSTGHIIESFLLLSVPAFTRGAKNVTSMARKDLSERERLLPSRICRQLDDERGSDNDASSSTKYLTGKVQTWVFGHGNSILASQFLCNNQ